MAQIIEHGKRVTVVEHELFYQYADSDTHWGYGFPCDEHGKVDESRLHPEGRASLARCRTGRDGDRLLRAPRVVSHRRSYWEPAIIRCACGRRLVLDSSWANQCECGREYNGSGQELAPRSQWGEETGEHWAELITPSLEDHFDY